MAVPLGCCEDEDCCCEEAPWPKEGRLLCPLISPNKPRLPPALVPAGSGGAAELVVVAPPVWKNEGVLDDVVAACAVDEPPPPPKRLLAGGLPAGVVLSKLDERGAWGVVVPLPLVAPPLPRFWKRPPLDDEVAGVLPVPPALLEENMLLVFLV